jgi:cytochrome oxidase assembly protein ShyY1
MLRRLFPSRSSVALALVAVALAALFVRLGIWQLSRNAERRALNASIVRAERDPARPLERLAPPGGDADPEELAFRRVDATGRYLVRDQVELYGRTVAGRPGDELLTPLLLADGRAVLVNRGWVPGPEDPPVGQATPPSGSVTVRGVLLPAEASTEPAGRGGEHVGVLTRIDITRIDAGLPYDLLPVSLLLEAQRPAQHGALPARAPLPRPDAGPFLSYAIQWFCFATIALVGYPILVLRRSKRDEAETATPSPPSPAPAAPSTAEQA